MSVGHGKHITAPRWGGGGNNCCPLNGGATSVRWRRRSVDKADNKAFSKFEEVI